MATRVGFIGLGNIGKPMAVNVAKAGFDVMVYDVRQEPLQELAAVGAKVARSAQEIGTHGEIIELVVVDDAQVEAIILGEGGVLNGRSLQCVAIHSTVHPRNSENRRTSQSQRAGVIDAEVSGGDRGAQNKTLCYMVGGDGVA
jgi:3-hydroxyisobutyrate dehydrogenase